MAKDKGAPEHRPTQHILRQTARLQAMANSPDARAAIILSDIAAIIVRDPHNQRIVRQLAPRHPSSGTDLEEFRLSKLSPIAETQWGQGLSPKARLDDISTTSLYFLMDSRPFAPEHRDYLDAMESQRKGARTHYQSLFAPLCDALKSSLPDLAERGIIPETGGFRARFYEAADDPMGVSAYITVPRQCHAALQHVGNWLRNVEYPTMIGADQKPLTSRNGHLIR